MPDAESMLHECLLILVLLLFLMILSESDGCSEQMCNMVLIHPHPNPAPTVRPRGKWGFVRTTVSQQNQNLLTPPTNVLPTASSVKYDC